jgi:DNA-binding GntR family transcriptional regulator
LQTPDPLGYPSHQPRIRRPIQLSFEVAAYVRELILTGQVRTGESLNIDRLARDLQVSSTPVREALLSLVGEGLVVFEPRRGFRASSLTARDLADIYWLQADIAGELASRAAERLGPSAIHLLDEIQSHMQAAHEASHAEDVERLNFEFHRTINRGAESPKLAWILGIATRYSPRQFYAMIEGWVEASLMDHAQIIDALRGRNADASRAAMRQHISHAGELLVRNLERQGLWASDGTEVTPTSEIGSRDASLP